MRIHLAQYGPSTLWKDAPMPVFSKLGPLALLRVLRTMLPVALVFALGARAQVFFGGGAQATVAASGLSAPEGVGADQFGNLYIADTGNNRVVRIAYTGVQTTVLSGTVLNLPLKAPNAVAADDLGSFYVADSGNNRVLKVTRSGAVSTVGTGLKDPSGVLVDYAADVLIADTGNNRIEIVTAAGVQSDIVPSSDLPAGMPLSGPTGISFEDSDFLFEGGTYSLIGLTLVIADTGNNRLVGVFYGGGQENRYTAGGAGLKSPRGVAYSGQAIFASDSGNNRLFFLPPYSNPYINPTQIQVGTGVSSPGGIATDGSGNLYIADTANNRIVKMQTESADFVAVEKGASAARTLTFVFASQTTLSATTPVEFLSPGAPTSDFKNANTGTCAATTYAAGASCTVNAVFKPTLAGERSGAVELVDTTGTFVNKVYVHGVGIAPQIVYDPGVQTTIASGLGDPLGIAVDGTGNVYIADTLNNRIDKVTPAGVMATLAAVTQPQGLAIDGAGDLYTIGFDVNFDRNDILRVTSAGIVKGTGIDVSDPVGITVDGQGNFYIADQFFGGVMVVFQPYYDTEYAITGGFIPKAVAVDDAGNFYVVDGTNWLVWKHTPDGEWSTVGSGYNRPQDVAVDVDGNVFVADFGNDRVVKVTPDGVESTVGAGLIQPIRVTLDSAGNIYIADSGNHRVVKIDRGAPPKLSFASTQVGKTSSDSPKEVTLENFGNAALTFPAPSTGRNASISAGFTLGGATTCPELSSSSSAATLAAGNTCAYAIGFTPTAAGAIAGSLAMTDNNLNVSSAKQTIALSGKATAAAVKVSWTTPAPIAAGAVLTVKQLDATASVPGKFAYSPAAGTKLAKGTHTLTTTFTPTDMDKYKKTTAKVDLIVK